MNNTNLKVTKVYSLANDLIQLIDIIKEHFLFVHGIHDWDLHVLGCWARPCTMSSYHTNSAVDAAHRSSGEVPTSHQLQLLTIASKSKSGPKYSYPKRYIYSWTRIGSGTFRQTYSSMGQHLLNTIRLSLLWRET